MYEARSVEKSNSRCVFRFPACALRRTGSKACQQHRCSGWGQKACRQCCMAVVSKLLVISTRMCVLYVKVSRAKEQAVEEEGGSLDSHTYPLPATSPSVGWALGHLPLHLNPATSATSTPAWALGLGMGTWGNGAGPQMLARACNYLVSIPMPKRKNLK